MFDSQAIIEGDALLSLLLEQPFKHLFYLERSSTFISDYVRLKMLRIVIRYQHIWEPGNLHSMPADFYIFNSSFYYLTSSLFLKHL